MHIKDGHKKLRKKQRKGENYEKNKKHAGSPWHRLCTFRYHRMQ